MTTIMAWRNIWRNPTRSLVVILAIGLGIWAAMFMAGFATGMSRSYVNSAVTNIYSHLQIHNPAFKDDAQVRYTIPYPDRIRNHPAVQDAGVRVSVRSITNGMIASGKATRGIQVKAVEPGPEAAVTLLNEKVIEGDYFGDRSNEILVSRRLADKLKVKLRSKLVLTFQDLNQDITAGAFRIAGIFESENNPFDDGHVFVKRDDLNRLLGTPADTSAIHGPVAHEIALFLEEPSGIDSLQTRLQADFPELLVENYGELSPDLELYESQIKSVSLIYLTIIMLALIFGIINTMLMAVLERIRELGMLMAIGMNKLRVFTMIVQETLLLSMVGLPVGLLLGWATNYYLGIRGINLSAFSESLKMYGLADTVYFELEPVVYWQVPLSVGLTALLASIYPAWKAIRLNPVEAIRKI